MSLPEPVPGLVIRYGFLWSDDARSGAEEGSKDRPCAIVLSSPPTPRGNRLTLVVPITHASPRAPETSLELPRRVCSALGLDGERHWIKLDELNEFAWPGYDLRPIPGSQSYAYGVLPPSLFEEVRRRVLDLALARRVRRQSRD